MKIKQNIKNLMRKIKDFCNRKKPLLVIRKDKKAVLDYTALYSLNKCQEV